MMQQKKPEDFVIATGHTHTVKSFIIECKSYSQVVDMEDQYEVKLEKKMFNSVYKYADTFKISDIRFRTKQD